MNARRTLDFNALNEEQEQESRMRFYVVEKLGDHQSVTPEGFLVITDVPLCRTGILIYGPNEVPIDAGPDGTVRIYREPEDVFHPDHIASIVGKSVVNDHPSEDVHTENWKRYHVGTVLNPRRGDGAQSDLLIGDLIIMDPTAIKDIRDGKREVSMGYDADYEETAAGVGKQKNLIANHVALVEAGRCGPRCAIKDSKSSTTHAGDDMKTRDEAPIKKPRRVRLSDESLAAIGEILESAKKEGEFQDEEGEGEHTHIHMHTGEGDARVHDDESISALMDQVAALEARVAALEGKGASTGDEESEEEKAAREAKEKETKDAEEEEAKKKEETKDESEAEKEMEEELEEEAPEGEKDKAGKAKDSVYLGDSYQATVAGAEILVPGIRVPTFDATAPAKDTFTAICGLRRKSLDLSYATSEGKEIIESLTGGKVPDIPGMSCGQVRQLFRGTVTAKKAANNSARTGDLHGRQSASPGPIKTNADFNKAMAEYWAKQ